MFERLRKKGFQVLALHHAEAILEHDLRPAIDDLETANSLGVIDIHRGVSCYI